MSCSETRTTLRYLRGELSERAANRCAQHLHSCTECRETMKFGAETMLAARGDEDSDSASAATAAGAHESMRPMPTARPFRGGLRMPGLFVGRPASAGAPARPRWILMAVTAGLIIWFVTRNNDAPSPAAAEPVLPPSKAALADGNPFVESPQGLLEGRPRAISALLPAGATEFRALLLDDTGAVCWSQSFRAGDPGVLAVDEAGGQRVLAPFPAADVLPLTAGRQYGISIAIPGARMAQAVRFTLAQR